MTTTPKIVCHPEHTVAHHRLHEALSAWARIVEQVHAQAVYPEESFLAGMAQDSGLCGFVGEYGTQQNWNPHDPESCPSRLMLQTFHSNFENSGAPFNVPAHASAMGPRTLSASSWYEYTQEVQAGRAHLNPDRIAFVREFLAGAYSPAGLFPSED